MGVISTILDFYENVRGEKRTTRKRDYSENSDYKFSGKKKDDFHKVEKTPRVPEDLSNKNRQENSRDER